MALDMIGPALVLAISACGTAIGCSIAGSVSHAMMSRVEEGHIKFIMFAAFPSTPLIYGCLLALRLQTSLSAEKISQGTSIAFGLGAGLAMAFTAVLLGQVAAASIQATAKQPAVAGKCWVSLGVIEAVGLFAFVFSYLLAG